MKFTIAIRVSHFAILTVIAVNALESPRARRKSAKKSPTKSRALKLEFRTNPPGMTRAKKKMMNAWTIPLKMVARTLERKMEVRRMGAARSLLRKPNRLSQTMEPPLYYRWVKLLGTLKRIQSSQPTNAIRDTRLQILMFNG